MIYISIDVLLNVKCQFKRGISSLHCEKHVSSLRTTLLFHRSIRVLLNFIFFCFSTIIAAWACRYTFIMNWVISWWCIFCVSGHSNGESRTLCLMRSMAMEPYHTKVLCMSSEESQEASTWHCKYSITCLMFLTSWLYFHTVGTVLHSSINTCTVGNTLWQCHHTVL